MERRERLPLFMLNTVLFPEQRLSLRVFEARYMDMITDCLKKELPFGLVSIRTGAEVGDIAEPMDVGTLAYIESWEMPGPGLLHIVARGGQRFHIEGVEHVGKLTLASVTMWEEEAATSIAPEYTQLVDFIRRIVDETQNPIIAPPHRFDDASWVGMRLAQLLPLPLTRKQAWLEQRDPLARLESIQRELDKLVTDKKT